MHLSIQFQFLIYCSLCVHLYLFKIIIHALWSHTLAWSKHSVLSSVMGLYLLHQTNHHVFLLFLYFPIMYLFFFFALRVSFFCKVLLFFWIRFDPFYFPFTLIFLSYFYFSFFSIQHLVYIYPMDLGLLFTHQICCSHRPYHETNFLQHKT